MTKNHVLFTDKQFPPNDTSLGNMHSRKKVVWKRLSEFVKNPVFIEKDQ